MTTQIEAVYEQGLLRPLSPLDLRESQQVRITLTDGEIDPLDELIDHQYLAMLQERLSGIDSVPTLDQVQAMLSRDKSCWADEIIAARGPR